MGFFEDKNIIAGYSTDLPLELGKTVEVTGTLPYTVFISGDTSSLDGLNIEELEYRWNFGDSAPPTNGVTSGSVYAYGSPQAMQRFLRPNLDNSTNNLNLPSYDGNFNTDQRAYCAAYTYWHNNGGTTFKPTMDIVYRGEVVSTVTGLAFRVLNDSESTGWITRTVNTNVTGSTTGHFANLHAAFNWINANRPNGRVKLLANHSAGSDYKWGLASGVYINVPDIVIATSTGVTTTQCTIFAASGYPTGNPREPFFRIGPSGYNVCIANMYFGNPSGAPFDPVGYNQGSPSTSFLRGIVIESGAANITIQGCSFRNLYQNIKTDDGSSRIFINNCYTNQTYSTAFAFDSQATIFAGNRAQAVESVADQALVAGTGDILCIGSGAVGTITNYVIFSNDLHANRSTSTLDVGCLHLSSTNDAFIEQNYFNEGNVRLHQTQNTRISRNTFIDGGNSANLVLDGVSYSTINNNVFIIAGLGTANCTAFKCIGASGNDHIDLVHNTFLFTGHQDLDNYEIDFGTGGITNTLYCNNLFINNGIFHLNKFVKMPGSLGGFFYASGNVYPTYQDNLTFATSGATNYSWTQYQTLGFEEIVPRNNIYPLDVHDLWNYKIDTVQNTGIFLRRYDDFYYMINSDFVGNAITTGTYLFPGAVNCSGRVYNPASTGALTGGIVASSRSRPSGATPSNTYYFNIDDTLSQVIDVSGRMSNKRIIGRCGGLNYVTQMFSGVGDYIATTGTFTFTEDGVDIHLNYTNDGPSNAANTSGTVLNTLGVLYFEGMNLGRYIKHVKDYSHITYQDLGDAYEVNFFKDALEYPAGTKYSPCWVFFGDDYALSVMVKYNFRDNPRSLYESSAFRASSNNRAFSLGLQWYSSNPSGQYLYQGQSLDCDISVRVTRDPARWYNTLYPYKTYFQSTYGTGSYFKDNRPIIGFNNVREPGQNLGYTLGKYNPTAASGWGNWANQVSGYIASGFERHMPWALAGYYSVSSLNYPFLVTTPLYDGLSPHNTYPNITGTLDILANSNLRSSDPIMYWGGTLRVVTGWEPSGQTIANPLNDSELLPVYDELDLAIYRLKYTSIGLDSIVGDATAYQQNVLIDKFISRYPGVKFMGEPSLCDFMNIKAASFCFMSSLGPIIQGPHYIKDYILPDAELQCWLNNNVLWTRWGRSGANTQAETLSQCKTVSEFGYTVGTWEFPTLVGVPSGNYLSKRVEFNISTIPSDVPTLAQPNISSITFDEALNSTYNITKQYIKLTWPQNTEADFSHYEVYKGLAVNGLPTSSNFQKKSLLKVSEYYDPTIENGLTYYYYVEAFDVYGNKSTSSTVGITPNFGGSGGEDGGGSGNGGGFLTILDSYGYKIATISKFSAYFIKN